MNVKESVKLMDKLVSTAISQGRFNKQLLRTEDGVFDIPETDLQYLSSKGLIKIERITNNFLITITDKGFAYRSDIHNQRIIEIKYRIKYPIIASLVTALVSGILGWFLRGLFIK
ncbi:hypothetical protein [Oenococcus sicerae]|uniref:hypothetical protein n=1 Tax=Oenococcus sicerae TaxID=2203724 RepID=UPI0039EAE818